jgi:hypothetical protein
VRTVSEKNCRENENKHFMLSNFFPKNLAVYEIMWKNVVEPERPTDDNMAHALCTLDK